MTKKTKILACFTFLKGYVTNCIQETEVTLTSEKMDDELLEGLDELLKKLGSSADEVEQRLNYHIENNQKDLDKSKVN